MAARAGKVNDQSVPKNALSEYASNLDCISKSRYINKISICDGIDPYSMKTKDFSKDFAAFPDLQFSDISNYLVVQTSFYTKSQMKAFKSLEAYNFFVCGWVNDVGVKILKDNNRLIFARVNHSQRSTKTPLKTWVILKKDGEVITAHCNCMAGLAESCSHVGAILYYIETAVRMRESSTCTMEKGKWLMPGHVKKINAASVCDIDFSSAKSKKQKLDQAVCGKSTEPVIKASPSCPRVVAGSEEYDNFFKELNQNFANSSALMIRQPYYKDFIPKSTTPAFPKCIMTYSSLESSQELTYDKLMEECQKLNLTVTEQQAKSVEAETRKQATSKIWFTQRAGRITASKLKAVLRTNPDSPSKSLIKSICYPEAHRFTCDATRYGCKHESQARKKYESMMSQQHDNFSVSDSGLRINPKWPHMGASPDGVVICECCGMGACEIKCPYCQKDKENIECCIGDKGFCLIKNDQGHIQLDRNHAYYFQVQTQLHIMESEYCDFIVWNENDIFIERIEPDIAFWNSILPKVELFFRRCILPEVLGKYYTKELLPPTLKHTNTVCRSE